MNDKVYYLKQNWSFGDDDRDSEEVAVEFFGFDDKDDNKDGHKLLKGSCLTFYELCGLKEAVDEVFENLLPRYTAQPDDVDYLLRYYPWLKEKADINPLFGDKTGKK
jgi:hypothetical protein